MDFLKVFRKWLPVLQESYSLPSIAGLLFCLSRSSSATGIFKVFFSHLLLPSATVVCWKVVFSQVCVKNSVHRVGCTPSPRRHPRGNNPPPETATAADGTHPTGINSCLIYILFLRKAQIGNGKIQMEKKRQNLYVFVVSTYLDVWYYLY